MIKEYLTNLKTLTGELSQGEVNTISNYLDAYSAFEISVEFFAREMLFADATTTYNTNHGAVEKSLSRAQKNADNLKEYILDVKSKTQGSAYWTASTWTDCKQDLDEMIENSADAVAKLILIYRDSVPNHIEHGGIQNNGFTDIIFDAMTDMMEDISKNSSQDAKFGSGLLQFVSAYLVKENEHVILNYPYNTILQQKVKTIQDNGKTAAEYQGFISGSWVTLYGRV